MGISTSVFIRLDTGLVALNAYRLSKGSSTLYELGHTFGLWHTFHGHEQGVYDEDGNKVFERDEEADFRTIKDFELLLKKKIASTKLGNLKKSKVSMKHMDIKQSSRKPVGFHCG